MPDPTLESVLLQKATSLQPGPMSKLDNFKLSHPGAGDVRAEIPLVPEVNALNTLAKVKEWKDWLASGEATGNLLPEAEGFLNPWLGNKAHAMGEMMEQGAKEGTHGADSWIRRVSDYMKSPSVKYPNLPGTLGTEAQRAAIKAAAIAGNGDMLLKFPKELVDDVLGGPVARTSVPWNSFVGGKAAPKLGGIAGNLGGSYVGGKINDAWRNYTGHNIVPSPTAVINKLMGRNDPDTTPQVR